MKPDAPSVEAMDFTPADDLERLELKIARRADAISERAGFDPHYALQNWLRAEWEILGDVGRKRSLQEKP